MSKPTYNLSSKKYTMNYLISHANSISSSKNESFLGFASKLAPRKGRNSQEFVAIAKWLGLSTQYLLHTLSSLSSSEVKKFIVTSLKSRKKNGV